MAQTRRMGMQTKGRNYPMRRGFRPTIQTFSDKIDAGKCSNPVHGDAKRKGTTTQCAEAIFASFGAPWF
jgi:hypothetical protein